MSNQNPIINNAIQANMNAMRDMLEKAATGHPCTRGVRLHG